MTQKLPVTVLTGFLGSGKTTLLNALLRRPELANTAVIVNEFGAIGLDHHLIEAAEDNVVLLDAGCLCCTIVNSLRETLADLQMRRTRGELPPFQRVIIETTGLADPLPILAVLTADRLVLDHYCLDGVVCCVDAIHAARQLAEQNEARIQVAVADRLIVTKTDLAPPADVARLRRELAERNPAAPIAEAVLGAIEPSALIAGGIANAARERERDIAAWLAAEAFHAGHDRAAPDVNRHDARIRAHGFLVAAPVSWAGLAAWCALMAEEHGEDLLRAKGIFWIEEAAAAVALHGVHKTFAPPQRLAAWPYPDRRGRLVVIARDIEAARLTDTLKIFALPPGTPRPLSFADAAE